MGETAQAGMPWSEIAESAYRAFCARMRGVLGDSAILVEWHELPTQIQWSWEAAVRQAGECSRVPLGGHAPDESHWAKWRPPQ